MYQRTIHVVATDCLLSKMFQNVIKLTKKKGIELLECVIFLNSTDSMIQIGHEKAKNEHETTLSIVWM